MWERAVAQGNSFSDARNSRLETRALHREWKKLNSSNTLTGNFLPYGTYPEQLHHQGQITTAAQDPNAATFKIIPSGSICTHGPTVEK